MVTVDYNALNSYVKDWGQIKKDLTIIEDQTTTFFGYGLPFIYLDQFWLFCQNGQK